jgi:hypothetical protein
MLGEDRVTTNGARRGTKVHMIYCVTKLCPWFETPWPVQVNEDGSIPDAYSQIGGKQYPKLSQELESKIQDNVLRQLEAETQPGGGEVANPNGN